MMRSFDLLRRRSSRPLLFACGVLLLWPLVHLGLVRQLGFSSWRLGGWGMYATPNAGTRDVVIVLRECDAEALPAASHAVGPRVLVIGQRGGRLRGLAHFDAEGHQLARRLAALRQDAQYRDFARWLRATHGLEPAAPLAVAIVDGRIDPTRRRALGHASARVLQSDQIIGRETFISTGERLAATLPPCAPRG